MKTKLQYALLALVFTAPFSYAQKAAPVETAGFSSPESIISDGKFLYVSNVGTELEPSKKDGDGFISRVSKEGKILDLKFLPTTGQLHAPKGSAIIGDVLYVADIDRLVGFNLNTKAVVFELAFEGTQFLNDVVVKDKQTLFASTTDQGIIYQVDIPQKKATPIKTDQPLRGPNGLAYDAATNTLYVAGFGSDNQPNGEVGKIDLATNAYTRLGTYQGYLDGIALITPSTLLFSDWIAFEKKGEVKKLDLKTLEVTTLERKEKVGGPADFSYDAKTKNIYLPHMLEGKISITPLR